MTVFFSSTAASANAFHLVIVFLSSSLCAWRLSYSSNAFENVRECARVSLTAIYDICFTVSYLCVFMPFTNLTVAVFRQIKISYQRVSSSNRSHLLVLCIYILYVFILVFCHLCVCAFPPLPLSLSISVHGSQFFLFYSFISLLVGYYFIFIGFISSENFVENEMLWIVALKWNLPPNRMETL